MKQFSPICRQYFHTGKNIPAAYDKMNRFYHIEGVFMSIDLHRPADPAVVTEFTEYISEQFPDVECSNIGESILGKNIPLIKLGHGKSASLFVGAHHGAEAITSLLLMRFAEDVLIAEKTAPHRLSGFDIKSILTYRSLYIVPMLNPDGVAIAKDGAEAAGCFRERVLSMNGSDDLSLWQANARGVDLNHNYDAEFTKCKEAEEALGILGGGPTRYGGLYPESEPETKALADLSRALSPRLKTAIALHTQGEEIYSDFCGRMPKGARMLAECFSRASGYTLASPPEEASYGGYKDFIIRAFDIPAFTIECGRGKNPLPIADFDRIYKKVLPILLTAAAF